MQEILQIFYHSVKIEKLVCIPTGSLKIDWKGIVKIWDLID